MVWKPISSAPKDGSIILVTGCNGSNRTIAAAYIDESVLEGETKYGWLGYLWPGATGWIAAPTHWMPLPRRTVKGI
jgi:hypothetical protein